STDYHLLAIRCCQVNCPMSTSILTPHLARVSIPRITSIPLVSSTLRSALNVAPLMATLTRGQTIWDLNSPPGEETIRHFLNAVVKKLCSSTYDLVMNEWVAPV